MNRRTIVDGRAYTMDEFIGWYGDVLGRQLWQQCVSRGASQPAAGAAGRNPLRQLAFMRRILFGRAMQVVTWYGTVPYDRRTRHWRHACLQFMNETSMALVVLDSKKSIAAADHSRASFRDGQIVYQGTQQVFISLREDYDRMPRRPHPVPFRRRRRH